MSDLFSNLRNGDKRSLSKAITLIESSKKEDQVKAEKLIEKILPLSGKSLRIGISGVPGVGKSTFIESFGQFLISQGKKIAVLAVDPSSPEKGGSIMGDKTRMEELSREENAFIRPTPSKGELGGVAKKTKETMLLCEASGFEIILVETVGVGQSEIEVANMVDCFLVLLLPNAGDELQGIKRGILELVDIIAINKADKDNIHPAGIAKSQYESALHLFSRKDGWLPPVVLCSALENSGILDVWEKIQLFVKSIDIKEKRQLQNKKWMKNILSSLIDQKIKNQSFVTEIENKVNTKSLSPFQAAKEIANRILK